MNRTRTALLSAIAGWASAAPLLARPDPEPPPPPPPVTVQADVSTELPMGPKGQAVTITGHIGAVIRQSGDGADLRIPIAAGLDITSPAALPKGTRLECINIVEIDSMQGWRWKEPGKDKLNLAPLNSPRIDPLPGGNIPPGRHIPVPEADYELFWEADMTGRNVTPASWVNSLTGMGSLNLAAAFAAGVTMDIAFADAANSGDKLGFATLFVLVDAQGRRVGVLGGLRWGVDTDGNPTATTPFSGLDGFTPQQLDRIARDSGYIRWRFVPTPGSAAILSLAALFMLPRATRPGRVAGSAWRAPRRPMAAD